MNSEHQNILLNSKQIQQVIMVVLQGNPSERDLLRLYALLTSNQANAHRVEIEFERVVLPKYPLFHALQSQIFSCIASRRNETDYYKKSLHHARKAVELNIGERKEFAKFSLAFVLSHAIDSLELSEAEEKAYLDEALDLVQTIDSDEVLRRVPMSTITSQYVRFYLRYEGQSRRLRKILQANIDQAIHIHGTDHCATHSAQMDMVCHLSETHQFQDAIEKAKELIKTLNKPPSERLYIAYIDALWGIGRHGKAIKVCNQAMVHVTSSVTRKAVQDRIQLLKKRVPHPKIPLRKVSLSKEKYQMMKNVSTRKKCGYCGKQSGKLLQCSQCEETWYCSKKHQRVDWKAGHKKHCVKKNKK